MGLDVFLVLSPNRPFTLFVHGASFRRLLWVPADKTCAGASIFPLFSPFRNSFLTARA
jgi:hypothetical protein